MAIKYVPYFPNTLEGQAILDNFVRTKRVLRYRDNDQVIDRIQRGMPLYEMELTIVICYQFAKLQIITHIIVNLNGRKID